MKLKNGEKKEDEAKPQLKKSLSALLEDLTMEGSDEDEKFDTDDLDHAKGVAKEVNLMKLKSEGLLEEARQREDEVYGGGEGSDKYMPMN